MTQSNVPGHLWNAQHKLERVSFTLNLQDMLSIGEVGLHAHGEASTARHHLWNYEEVFDDLSQPIKGYSAADALHHIALVAMQDRPVRLDDLELALRGGVSWSQPPLL